MGPIHTSSTLGNVSQSTSPADYIDLLERIHEHVLPRTYLEIGIRDGRSLALALPGTRVLGIDPAFALAHPLVRNAQCFAETSDNFFAARDPRTLIGGLPIDLAFIDGMHKFEFALRDFANVERSCGPDSTILIHDCNPRLREEASRKQQTYIWAGDVWKLIACLRTERPDLDVSVIDVGPTGLGVIRSLDPSSTKLFDSYDDIVAKYGALDFDELERDRHGILNVVDADWNAVVGVLPNRPMRRSNATVLRLQRQLRVFIAKARRRLRPETLRNSTV